MKRFLHKLDHDDGFAALLIMFGPGAIVALLNLLSPWFNLLPVQSATKARSWLPKFDADYLTVQQYYSTELAEKFVLNQVNLIIVTVVIVLIVWPLKFLRPGVVLPTPEMKSRGKLTVKALLISAICGVVCITGVFVLDASFYAEPDRTRIAYTAGIWGYVLSASFTGLFGFILYTIPMILFLMPKNWD